MPPSPRRLLARLSSPLTNPPPPESPNAMATLRLLAAHSTPTYPGLSTPVYPYPKETPHPLLSGTLRRGKWTPEEEQYAAAIIRHFLAGVLPIQYGTTLRGYIAQLLHCDPMRVSKKLVPGTVFVDIRINPKLGRRSYYPLPVDTPGLSERKKEAEWHLSELRADFIESIEREEEQESATKAIQVDVHVHGLAQVQAPQQSPSPQAVQFERYASARCTCRVSSVCHVHFEPPHYSYGSRSLPSMTDLLRHCSERAASPVGSASSSPGGYQYGHSLSPLYAEPSSYHLPNYEMMRASSSCPCALPPLRRALSQSAEDDRRAYS